MKEDRRRICTAFVSAGESLPSMKAEYEKTERVLLTSEVMWHLLDAQRK